MNDYKTGSGGKRKIETFSYNHYCSGEAINISYSESFVCSLRNIVCNAPALYCHLCSALIYCIFYIISYILRIGRGGGDWIKNACFNFLYNIFSETFQILSLSQSDPIIHVCSARYSCHTLVKLEFSRQIVEKYWNITFMKMPPVGAEIFLRDRGTD
jgi:hypothetical protein